MARAGKLVEPRKEMDRQRSVFGALGAANKTKDPRPLHNKSYMQQCVRKLREFLSENAYPGGEVSIKAFQSRSAKEFLRVFEFLFQQLDPTFVLPKSKVEEEVPRLLRNLGYTVFLSKSSMYSVGAPHTWPKLLGALIWLIDKVKDPLMKMRMELETLQTDLPLYYRALLKWEASILAEELEATGDHLDSLTQEGARLQHLLDNFNRLNREKMELQKEISILSKAQEEAEQHALQEEMGLAKVKERVVSKVAELIPASAEGACGHDFEIQTAFLDQPGAIVRYKEQIQLPLKKMVADVAKENERLVNKKLSLQATYEEVIWCKVITVL